MELPGVGRWSALSFVRGLAANGRGVGFLIPPVGTRMKAMEVAMTEATQSNAAVLVRLRRIEGQIRGLHRMVDEDEQCMDVLTQISAVTKALQSVAILMLEGHLSECVTSAMGDDTVDMDEKLHEVTAAIARLVRS